MSGIRRGFEESWNIMVIEFTRVVFGEFIVNGGFDILFI